MSQLFTRAPSGGPKRSPQVRVSRATYGKFVFRRIGKVILYAFIGVLIVYFSLAATLLRVVPTTSGAGPVLVKNITYPGGLLPAGAAVLIDQKSAQEDDVWVHLRQASMPADNAAVVKVIAGPYGALTWTEPGVVTVDGELVSVALPTDPDTDYLENEYLAECISGACEPGEGLIFSEDYIYGSVVSLTEQSNK